MKKWISILLLACLIVPFGIKFSILLDYTLDFNYYKNVLCKNKDIPEMHCNGSCALMQKLKEKGLETKQENGIPQPLTIEIPVFIVTDFNCDINFSTTNTILNNHFKYDFFIKSHNLSPLTPPPLV